MLKLHAVPESAPTIDAAETRWVARELSSLLRQIDPESPAGHILRQSRRELESLVRSVEAAEFVSPLKAAA